MNLFLIALGASTLAAQAPQGGGPANEAIRQASQLDLDGKGAEARALFERAVDSAATPAAKAAAQRAMAMSWAFEGNCAKTAQYEHMAMEYWKTQEKDVPANAFYQQGELADEAARVCIDQGDLKAAQDLYKEGHDVGLKEPGIPAGRKDLWNYRWEHAQARIAARRGSKSEAATHVAAATAILANLKQDDAKLYEQQVAFLPYLNGYIALYTGDAKGALESLLKANQSDAFIQCLIGMAYEKLGDKASATEFYRKAADARGHNPPAAFARPFARKKLG